MSEARRQVLEMLAAGKITAEEAERLITALEREIPQSSPAGGAEARHGAKPRYLRVVVDSDDPNDSHGPIRVNTRVPMQLLRAGVKLAALIPPQARDHVDRALRDQGIPFNTSQIRPENLEEIVDQLSDLTVDVDLNDLDRRKQQVRVRVFCE
jgi:polyhydroxyalkanoate synthesis regulator phasin